MMLVRRMCAIFVLVGCRENICQDLGGCWDRISIASRGACRTIRRRVGLDIVPKQYNIDFICSHASKLPAHWRPFSFFRKNTMGKNQKNKF